MSSATVFGFIRPISSTKSARWILIVKVSIALSSETSSAEFLMILQRCIYEQSDSLGFWVQALTSSVDAGLL
jgi:hypothetical protein